MEFNNKLYKTKESQVYFYGLILGLKNLKLREECIKFKNFSVGLCEYLNKNIFVKKNNITTYENNFICKSFLNNEIQEDLYTNLFSNINSNIKEYYLSDECSNRDKRLLIRGFLNTYLYQQISKTYLNIYYDDINMIKLINSFFEDKLTVLKNINLTEYNYNNKLFLLTIKNLNLLDLINSVTKNSLKCYELVFYNIKQFNNYRNDIIYYYNNISLYNRDVEVPQTLFIKDMIKYSDCKIDFTPFKNNITDSGYDLFLLEKVKEVGNVIYYDTGIKVQPPYGYYFDLVPRSSITKHGYMLANSVGIIDASYQNNILVPLIKINPEAKDLTLPLRLVQLILRKNIITDFKQIETFNNTTTRNTKGFGSSGD